MLRGVGGRRALYRIFVLVFLIFWIYVFFCVVCVLAAVILLSFIANYYLAVPPPINTELFESKSYNVYRYTGLAILILQTTKSLIDLITYQELDCSLNMGKTCAVPACKSGSLLDRTMRKKKKQRSVTFFKIPKHNNILSRWSEALNTQLKATDVICENHFLSKYILKNFKTIMPDGTVDVIERGRYTLTSDAVPGETSDGDWSNDECVPIKVKSDCSLVVRKEKTFGKIVKNITEEESNSSSSSGGTEEYSSDSPAESPTKPAKLSSTSPANLSSTSPAKLSSSTPAKLSSRSPAKLSSNQPTNSSSNRPPKPIQPFISVWKTIKEQLRIKALPECWSWNGEETRIIFTYIERFKLKPMLHLSLAEDLSLSMWPSCQKEKKISIDSTVSCFEDLAPCFRTASKTQVCDGTGIAGREHPPECSGFLDLDNRYQRNILFRRCRKCRQLRIIELKKLGRSRNTEKIRRQKALKRLEEVQKLNTEHENGPTNGQENASTVIPD